MQDQINELKKLRANLALWKDQKYHDDQARQEAVMNGGRHNTEATEKIKAEIKKAEAALANFELWNYDAVEALDQNEAAEAKAETEQAIKSAWNN